MEPGITTSYINSIKQIGRGLLSRSLIAYILMQQGTYLSATWFLVLAKQRAQDMRLPVALFGLRELACVTAVLLFTFALKKIKLSYWIWRITWIVIIVAGALLLGPFGQINPVFIIAGGCVVILFKSMSVVASIDAYTDVIDGEWGRIRMAVFNALIPFFSFILSVTAGWLSEHYQMAAFGICMVMACVILCLTYSQSHFTHIHQKERRPIPIQGWYLIALSSMHNTFNIVISFVIVPLYIFDKSGGDFSRFGFWIGLLALIVLAGQMMKQRLNKEPVQSKQYHFSVLAFGLLLIPISNIAWGITYSGFLIPMLFLGIRQIATTVWNAFYFIVMKDHLPNSSDYASAVRMIMIITRTGMAIGFSLSAYIFIGHPEIYREAILILGGVCLLLDGAILLLFKQKFIK